MTDVQKPPMAIGFFLISGGQHEASWRHPEAHSDAGENFERTLELVKRAEAAKLHFVFFADAVGVRDTGSEALRHIHRIDWLEPLTLLPALAAVTRRIGLVATASTTYNHPYHIARRLSSLDHISHGRAGWNVVTSASVAEAQNFGDDELPEHDERYARAEEFLQVVRGLWDSWDDGAFIRDKASGVYVDERQLHILNHKGKYFTVKGPLNTARPPQGHPLIVQAGASGAGKGFAARNCDVVFTAADGYEAAAAFYSEMKERAAASGRDPDGLKIMPGVLPIVGRTREEAEEKYQSLQALIHPTVGLAVAGRITDRDLRGYPVDGPIPEDDQVTNGNQSRQKLLLDNARARGMTIRQLYEYTMAGRGHWTVKGTAKDICDQMEHWYRAGAADGFNVLGAMFPGSLIDFVGEIIPELQRRGTFRDEYAEGDLRTNLGLRRPARG